MEVDIQKIQGIWHINDDTAGKELKAFIESHSNSQVVKIDVEQSLLDLYSKIQGSERFLILLSEDLLGNHELLIYITRVLYQLHKNEHLTLTLVKLDKCEVPINLKSLGIIDITQKDQICKSVTGTVRRIKDVLPIGNVGIGLAWSYYYGYLNLILPGIQKRILNSKYEDGSIFTKFLILLPESCETPARMQDVDPRFQSLGPLDEGFKTARAGQPERVYKNFVNKVTGTDGKEYFFCGEFATPLLAMWKMLEDDLCQVDEREMKKQMELFYHTLMSLLNDEKNRLCKGFTHLLRYPDQLDGKPYPLADEICKLILEPSDTEEAASPPDPLLPSSVPTDTMKRSSSISTVSTLVIINTAKVIAHDQDEIMAKTLVDFCDDIGIVCMSEYPEKVINSMQDLLGNPPPQKVFVILSKASIPTFQSTFHKIINQREFFERTTFILERAPEDPIPDWLEYNAADYIDSRKDKDQWKRIMGSLFGTSTIEGIGEEQKGETKIENLEKWQKVDASVQYQVNKLPIGKVAEGLAWAYYHNYLALIVPSIPERIEKIQYYKDRKMAKKLFILCPYSCFSYPTLTEADENITLAETKSLKPLVIEIAGNKRTYNTGIHQIKHDDETYYACVEYCTPVLVMYEMEAEGKAGLTKLEKEAQLAVFHKTLTEILQRTTIADTIQLVYYKDLQNDKDLSEILVDAIKESL